MNLKKLALAMMAALAGTVEGQSLSIIPAHSILYDTNDQFTGLCEISSFPSTTSPLSVFTDGNYSLLQIGSNPYILNFSVYNLPLPYNGGNQSILLDCEHATVSPIPSPWKITWPLAYPSGRAAVISPAQPIDCTLYNVPDQSTVDNIDVRVYAKNYTATNGAIGNDEVLTIPPGKSVDFSFKSNETSTMEFIAIPRTGLETTVFLSCSQSTSLRKAAEATP